MPRAMHERCRAIGLNACDLCHMRRFLFRPLCLPTGEPALVDARGVEVFRWSVAVVSSTSLLLMAGVTGSLGCGASGAAASSSWPSIAAHAGHGRG